MSTARIDVIGRTPVNRSAVAISMPRGPFALLAERSIVNRGWRMSSSREDVVVSDTHDLGPCLDDWSWDGSGESDPEKEYYGGHFICESVRPAARPLMLAAPDLLEACQTARGAVFALVEMLTAEMTGEQNRDLRHLNCRALAEVAKILTAAIAKAGRA